MALNIDKVFRFVQFVANKESRGWISPEEFNIAAELAQLAVYSRLEAMFLSNKKVHKELRPFLKYDDLTPASDIMAYPSDFGQFLSAATATGVDVRELTQTEANPIINSTICPPAANYPFVVLKDDGMRLYPTGIAGDITVDYLAKPDPASPPEWGYTLTNNRPVYSSGASTDFQLGDGVFTEIATNVLMNVGLNIGKDNIAQYGMAFNSQG